MQAILRYNHAMVHQTTSQFIQGPSGKLELRYHLADSPKMRPLVVVCHPDPRQEGTMDNKVVTMTARAFFKLGCSTVCFNYRGVGASAGVYGHVDGECADLEAVLDWVRSDLNPSELWLAGFSFGSFISAQVAHHATDIKQLLSIAPPVQNYNYSSLNRISCPWWILQGEADTVVDLAQLRSFVAKPPSPLHAHWMGTAGHFFHGCLLDLSQWVATQYEPLLLGEL